MCLMLLHIEYWPTFFLVQSEYTPKKLNICLMTATKFFLTSRTLFSVIKMGYLWKPCKHLTSLLFYQKDLNLMLLTWRLLKILVGKLCGLFICGLKSLIISLFYRLVLIFLFLLPPRGNVKPHEEITLTGIRLSLFNQQFVYFNCYITEHQ